MATPRFKSGAGIPTGGPWRAVPSVSRPARDDTSAKLGTATFRATERGLEQEQTGQIVFRTLDQQRAFHFRGQEDVEPGVTLPLRPVAQPWVAGCYSRPELEAAGELAAVFYSNGALSVFGVKLTDALNVRALPSVDSRVVVALAPLSGAAGPSEIEPTSVEPSGGIEPSGNVCRVSGQDWVQVHTASGIGWASARFLRHLAPSRPDTERVRDLLHHVSGAPGAQAEALRVALTALTKGEEGARPAELLGVKTEKNRARALLTAGAPPDDSISGQVLLVEFEQRGARWQVASGTVQDVCARGLSAEGLCL